MMLESVLEKGSFYYAVDFDLTTNLQHQYKQQQQPHLPFWQRVMMHHRVSLFCSLLMTSRRIDAFSGIGTCRKSFLKRPTRNLAYILHSSFFSFFFLSQTCV